MGELHGFYPHSCCVWCPPQIASAAITSTFTTSASGRFILRRAALASLHLVQQSHLLLKYIGVSNGSPFQCYSSAQCRCRVARPVPEPFHVGYYSFCALRCDPPQRITASPLWVGISSGLPRTTLSTSSTRRTLAELNLPTDGYQAFNFTNPDNYTYYASTTL